MLLLEVEAPRTEEEGWLGYGLISIQAGLGEVRGNRGIGGNRTASIGVGFEQWVPTEQDVAALKDASKALTESLWTDESGPPPPEEEAVEAQPLHRVLGEDDFLMDYQADNELIAAAFWRRWARSTAE